MFLPPSRTSSPDADGDGNVGLPSSPAEEEEEDLLLGPIARDLAKELSIPLIIPECPAEEGGGGSSAFGHHLRIVPYARGSMRTYAVAIQPSPPIEAASRRRQKRRRKKDDDPAMRPFYVEFVPPPGSRVGKVMGGGGGGGGTELLLRAVAPQRRQGQGKHSETGMIVWDLTAGFGRDAALVAAGGAEAVVMIERDPVVAALLRDGLRRLCLVADSGLGDDCDDETVGRAAYLSERLSLEEGDGSDAARRLLSEGAEDRNENDNDKSRERRRRGIGRRPDVCYLDPMFPPRTKSAAVKKDMQILHSLLGSNPAEEMDVGNDGDEMMNGTLIRASDERELLRSALDVAGSRVVVKRPIKAPLLGEGSVGSDLDTVKPSHSIRGSVNRWDVYVKV